MGGVGGGSRRSRGARDWTDGVSEQLGQRGASARLKE